VTAAQTAPITVTLTSPANGASFKAPANLAFAATVSGGQGAITNVGFFLNSTLLGNDTSAPFTFTSANVFAGSYALTAVATDSTGARGTSGVVNVTVTNTPALTVLQSIKTVFVIAFENHDFTQTNPTATPQQLLHNVAAPYFNSLITPGNPNAAQVAYASNYLNAGMGVHSSEPNYVWSEAGTDFGVHTDNDPSAASHNVFSNVFHLSGQLTTAGVQWRSYQEDVQYSSSPLVSASGSGVPVNPYNGTNLFAYAVKHNPMQFFPDTQKLHVFPLTNFWTDLTNNKIGRYNWLTPDLYNDMHNPMPGGFKYHGTTFTGDQSAIAVGDNFLSIVIPKIMASAAYQDHGMIVLWWDETESTDNTKTTIPFVIISSLSKGNAYVSPLAYSHSSDLKTMDEIFSLAYQTNAIPTGEVDAQNNGLFNYVDGHSATVNDFSDFLTVPSGQSGTLGANSAPTASSVIQPAPRIIGGKALLGAGGFQLTFAGPAGHSYKVLASDDLTLPMSQWQVLDSGTFGSDNAIYSDPDAVNHPNRFYIITSP
jgi:hypothetical protein